MLRIPTTWKGEVFAYAGLPQNLKDLKDARKGAVKIGPDVRKGWSPWARSRADSGQLADGSPAAGARSGRGRCSPPGAMPNPGAHRRWRRAGAPLPQQSSWNVLLAGRFPDFDVGRSQNVNVIIRTMCTGVPRVQGNVH